MPFFQKLVLFLTIFISSVGFAAPKVHILWLMHNDNPFWTRSQTIAREAAQDLGIETSFLLATPGDRLSAAKVTEKALNELKKREGVRTYLACFGNFVDAEKVFALAKAKDVSVFLFNSAPSFPLTFRKGEFAQVLGGIYPDDEQAGYAEAKALLAEGKRRKHPEPQHIIALGGWNRDTVDEERRKGLYRAAAEEKAIVDQYFQTRWDKEVAKGHILRARQKFPDTKLYWNIADYLGLGTLEWLEKDAPQLIVGGVDWSSEAMDSLQKEHGLWVSVGGHFLEPAWVTALLYDHAQGLDFVDVYPEGLLRSPMSVLERNQVRDFLKKYPESSWEKIDYRMMSRSHSKRKSYDFRLESLSP